MSAPATYRCNHTRSVVLAAATPLDVDVPIDGAKDWTVVVKNIGANPLTALSIARIPLALPAAPVVATDGIPLAAGATLPAIVGENAPVAALRLTLTSTLGTTVSLEAGGA